MSVRAPFEPLTGQTQTVYRQSYEGRDLTIREYEAER